MTLEQLISDIHAHAKQFPEDASASLRTIEWINKYQDFAFVKENLEGHVTASIWITNPSHTRVLLMFHKRFQMWTQFGGHCDGEIDTQNVALREFHEESGIMVEPKMYDKIFSIQTWDVKARTSSSGMYQPDHQHYDILYLGQIDDTLPLSRQEDEVDDIRWCDIHDIPSFVSDLRMLTMVDRIQKIFHI